MSDDMTTPYLQPPQCKKLKLNFTGRVQPLSEGKSVCVLIKVRVATDLRRLQMRPVAVKLTDQVEKYICIAQVRDCYKSDKNLNNRSR